jgi:hypothetical protein
MVNQKIPNVLVRHVNSGNLPSLKPIIDAWIDEILQRYVNYFSEDVPWRYNERATLSSLAAAAWMVEGGISLEEYKRQKGKKSNPLTGSCDLFLGTKRACFECEAKQTWCAVGRKAWTGVERARSGLKDACDDAKELPETKGVRRLGLCFLIPYLPIGDKDYVVEQIKKWLKGLDGLKKERDCIAWAFPEKTRYIERSDKQIYPGVVLLVKEV